jgi:protein tyrosine/serine phosphatase
VFRSNSLQELTDDDVATLVERVGIATVIDLRAPEEIARDGRGPLEAHRVRWVEAPLRPYDETPERAGPGGPETLAERYWMYLDRATPNLLVALRALAADGVQPAVFHCAAGKDRTGVLAALLLGCLGVTHDHVVADYSATRHERERLIDFLRRRPSYARTIDTYDPDLLTSEPATMEKFLHRMERVHGGVRAWALSVGLEPATLARLEESLLEP